MKNLDKSTAKSLHDNVLFTRRFHFRTPVPMDVCADRIGGMPFVEGNSRYTTEVVPTRRGYHFYVWAGNKHQREPHKARVISTGQIIQRGEETIIEGEAKIGVNRMLMLAILTILMGFWLVGMFSSPLWFLYMFYTAGLPIIAPMYLFWQTLKERNRLINDVQLAVTPHLSDQRAIRLSDQHSDQEVYTFVEEEKQLRGRQ